MTTLDTKHKALELLKQLIATPSFSKEEHDTANLISCFLSDFDIPFERHRNNILAFNKNFDSSKPTLLLNSHHDTVKPNSAYTRDPFDPKIEDGKLFGLGSNDAGGALVSLLATFVHFYNRTDINHNLVIVASAEEENSGANGLESVLPLLPTIDLAIVGEPTLMDMAIAEKGLVVFDAKVTGTPSHAAHINEDNAIYKAIKTLEWFRDYRFEKVSPMLGNVKMTVTQLNAGTQHNVVPTEVNLVIDVRVNDCYSNQEIAHFLQAHAPCTQIKTRSLRLNASSIPITHSLVKIGVELGLKTYGSPTVSDQAVLSCPSLKLGPGDSKRSHSADEFIYLEELMSGIDRYVELLQRFLSP